MVQVEKKTQKEAAERFQVSISSAKRWLKRKSLIPDKAGPKQAWSINLHALKALVTNEPDNYLDEYCNTDVILSWVKNEFIPFLKAGMTLIWDNAAFHKSAEIKALIESAGCKLIFLPPYSPDLKPIEHFWAKLKARIRRLKQDGRLSPMPSP